MRRRPSLANPLSILPSLTAMGAVPRCRRPCSFSTTRPWFRWVHSQALRGCERETNADLDTCPALPSHRGMSLQGSATATQPLTAVLGYQLSLEDCGSQASVAGISRCFTGNEEGRRTVADPSQAMDCLFASCNIIITSCVMACVPLIPPLSPSRI